MKILDADSNELDQLDTHHTEKTDQVAYHVQNSTQVAQNATQAAQATTQAAAQTAQ